MATQEADRPQGKKRTSIFSGKLRTITVILGLIFAVAGLIFWIIGINNDNTHIDKIMGAIFTFLLLVCAFLTIPFLSSSEESPATALSQIPQPSPSPQIQVNPTFNINQTNAQHLYGSTIPTVNTVDNNVLTGQIAVPNNNPQPQQQPSSGNTHGLNQLSFPGSNTVPSPSINENQASKVDEGELLDGLIACSSGAFSRIVACIELPASWRPSDKADPAEKATNLINWANHPKGPGIEALNTCYEQALGIAKKK